MTMVPLAVTDWVADSGASNHTTLDASNLTSVHPPHINDPSSIIVGNESSLLITSVCDTTLLGSFYLNNVLVTADIIQNLLYVHRYTTDNWCSIEFDHFGLSVNDLSTRNMIIRCDSSGSLYTMRLPSRSTPSSSVVAPTTFVASTSTWHRHLGHHGVDTMSNMSNASSVVCTRHTHDLCHACQLGHHTRIPFVSSAFHANNNFDLIHCVLWTSPIVSISLCKYYLVIFDNYSHFMLTFPLHVKSDTFPTLSIFSPLFARSLAAPSRPSSVTMVMSLTMPPPVHSLPPVVSSCGCPTHTPLRRMLKLSVSCPYIALYGVTPSYEHLHVFDYVCYPNLFTQAAHKLAPGPLIVSSSDTLLITKDIGVLIFSPTTSSSSDMLSLMRQSSPSLPRPCLTNDLDNFLQDDAPGVAPMPAPLPASRVPLGFPSLAVTSSQTILPDSPTAAGTEATSPTATLGVRPPME
jgi:hypothetical protein